MANTFSTATLGLGVDTTKFLKEMRSTSSLTQQALDSMKLSADAFTAQWGSMTAGIKDTKRIVSGILVSQGFYALSNALLDAGSAALSFAKNMETAAISMEYFVEGANKMAKAQAFLRTMNEFAARTPFSTEEALSLSKYMQAVGVSMNTTKSFLKVITDTAAATGATEENLQRIVFGLGQMMTKGRLANEEIRQLANANIPIYEILQEQLGLSGAQIAQIGRNWVDADKAVVAILTGLEERYAGAADRVADTVTGMTDTIKDNAKIIAQIASSGLYDSLADKMTVLRDALDRYREIASTQGSMGLFDTILRDIDSSGRLGTEILALIGHTRILGASLRDLYIAGKPVIDLLGHSLYASIVAGEIVLTGFSKTLEGVLDSLEKLGITTGTVSEVLGSLFIAYQAAKWVSFLGEAAVAGAYHLASMASTASLILPASLQASVGIKVLSTSLAGVVMLGLTAYSVFSLLNSTLSGIGETAAGDLFPSSYSEAMEKYNAQMAAYNEQIAANIEAYNEPFAAIADGADSASDALKDVEDTSTKAAKKVKDSWLATFDEVYAIPKDNNTATSLAAEELADLGLNLSLPEFKFPTIKTDDAIAAPTWDWDDAFKDGWASDIKVLDENWWKTFLPVTLLGAAVGLGKAFSKIRLANTLDTGSVKSIRSAVLEGFDIQKVKFSKAVDDLAKVDTQIADVLRRLNDPSTSPADRKILLAKLDELINTGDDSQKAVQKYGALLDKKASELIDDAVLNEAKRVKASYGIKNTLDKIDEYNRKLLDDTFRTSPAGEAASKEIRTLTKQIQKTYDDYAIAYGPNIGLEALIKDSGITLKSIDADIARSLSLAQEATKKYSSILDILRTGKLTTATSYGVGLDTDFIKTVSTLLSEYQSDIKAIAKIVEKTGVPASSVGVDAYYKVQTIVDDFAENMQLFSKIAPAFNTLQELKANPIFDGLKVDAVNEQLEILNKTVYNTETSFRRFSDVILATDESNLELLRSAAEQKKLADELRAIQREEANRLKNIAAEEASRRSREARLAAAQVLQQQQIIEGNQELAKLVKSSKKLVLEQVDQKDAAAILTKEIESSTSSIKTLQDTLDTQIKQQKLNDALFEKISAERLALYKKVKAAGDKAFIGDTVRVDLFQRQMDELNTANKGLSLKIDVTKKALKGHQDGILVLQGKLTDLNEEIAKTAIALTDNNTATYKALQQAVADATKTLDTKFIQSLNKIPLSKAMQDLVGIIGTTTDDIAASGTKLYRLMNGLGSFDGDIMTMLSDTLMGAGGLKKIGAAPTSSFAKNVMALGNELEGIIATYGKNAISVFGEVFSGTYAANVEQQLITQLDRTFKEIGADSVLSLDVKTMTGSAIKKLSDASNKLIDGVYEIAASELAKVKPEYYAQFAAQAITTDKSKVVMMAFDRNFDYAGLSSDFVKRFRQNLQVPLGDLATKLSGKIFSAEAIAAYGNIHPELEAGEELVSTYMKKVVIPTFESTFGKNNFSAIQKATQSYIVNYAARELDNIRAAGYGKKWKELEDLVALVANNDNISKYLKTYVEVETAVGKRVAAIDFAGVARRYKTISSSANKWLASILGDSIGKFNNGALGPLLKGHIDAIITAFNETGDGLKFTEDLQFILEELGKLKTGTALSEEGKRLFADTVKATYDDYDKLSKALSAIQDTQVLTAELPRKMRAVIDQVTSINNSIDLGVAVKGEQVRSVLEQLDYIVYKLGISGSDASKNIINQLNLMLDTIKGNKIGEAVFADMQLKLPFKSLGIEDTLNYTIVAIADAVKDGSLKIADSYRDAFERILKSHDVTKLRNEMLSKILGKADLSNALKIPAKSVVLDIEATSSKLDLAEISQVSMKNLDTGEMFEAFINYGEEQNKRIYSEMVNIYTKTGELTDVSKQWLKSVTVEDLNKGITIQELKRLLDSYGAPGIQAVGYNTTGYDIPIMNRIFGEGTFVDATDVMKELERRFSVKFKLSDIYEIIFEKIAEGAHLASSDVEMTAKLLDALQDGTIGAIEKIAKKIKGKTSFATNVAEQTKALIADAVEVYGRFGDESIRFIEDITKDIGEFYTRIPTDVLRQTATKIPEVGARVTTDIPAVAAKLDTAADDLITAAASLIEAATVSKMTSVTEFLKALQIQEDAAYRILSREGAATIDEFISGNKLQTIISNAIAENKIPLFDIFDSSGAQIFNRAIYSPTSVNTVSDDLFKALDSIPTTLDSITAAAKTLEMVSPDVVKALSNLDIGDDVLDSYSAAIKSIQSSLVDTITKELGNETSDKIAKSLTKAFSAADFGIGVSQEDLYTEIIRDVKNTIGKSTYRAYSDAIDTAVKQTITESFAEAAKALEIPTVAISDDVAQATGKAVQQISEEVATQAGKKIGSIIGDFILGGAVSGGVGLIDVAALGLEAYFANKEQKAQVSDTSTKLTEMSKANPELADALSYLTTNGVNLEQLTKSDNLIAAMSGKGGILNSNDWEEVGFDIGTTLGGGIVTALAIALGAAVGPAGLIGALGVSAIQITNSLLNNARKDTFSNATLSDFLSNKTTYNKAIESGMSSEQADAIQKALETVAINTRFSELNSKAEIEEIIYGSNAQIAEHLKGISEEAKQNRLLRINQMLYPDKYPQFNMLEGTAGESVAIRRQAYLDQTGQSGLYYQSNDLEMGKAALDWVFKNGQYDTALGKELIAALTSSTEEREALRNYYGGYIDAFDLRDEFLGAVNEATGKNYTIDNTDDGIVVDTIISYISDLNTREESLYEALAGKTTANRNIFSGDVSSAIAGDYFSNIDPEILNSLKNDYGITLSTMTDTYTNAAGDSISQLISSLSIDSDEIRENIMGWTKRLPENMNIDISGISTEEMEVLASAGIQINSDGSVTFMKAQNENVTGQSRKTALNAGDIGAITQGKFADYGIDFKFGRTPEDLTTVDLNDSIGEKMSGAMFRLSGIQVENEVSDYVKEQLAGLGKVYDSGFIEITNKAVLNGKMTVQEYVESLGEGFGDAQAELRAALVGIDGIIAQDGEVTKQTIAEWADGIVVKSPIDEKYLTTELEAGLAAMGITFETRGEEFVMIINKFGQQIKDGVTTIATEDYNKLSEPVKKLLADLGVDISQAFGFTTIDIGPALENGIGSVIAAYVDQPEIWNLLPAKAKEMLIEMGVATNSGFLELNAETLAGLGLLKLNWTGFMDDSFSKFPKDIRQEMTDAGIETNEGLIGIGKYIDESSIPEGVENYIVIPFSEVPDDVKESMGDAATALEDQDVVIYNATATAFSLMKSAVTAAGTGAVTEAQAIATAIGEAVANALLEVEKLQAIERSTSWKFWEDKSSVIVEGKPGAYYIRYGGEKFGPINATSEAEAIKKANTMYPDARIPTGTTPTYAFGGLINKDGLYRAGEFGKTEAVIPLENRQALAVIGKAIASTIGMVSSPVQAQQLSYARGIVNAGVVSPVVQRVPEAPMQQLASSMADSLVQSLAPILARSNNSSNNEQRPLYVGTLVADDKGLRELYRKMQVIEMTEKGRTF